MLFHIINTAIIVNRVVHKFIFVSKSVFGDVDLLVVWIIFLDTHDLVIQPLRIDNPVPVSTRYIVRSYTTSNTFDLVFRASFFTFTVVDDFSFTIKGFHPVTHVVVNSKEVVQIFSCFKRCKVFVPKIQTTTINRQNVVYPFHGCI